MLRLKKRLKPAEQGFTLFEVLIAILVTTLFISVAMQAMVFAAVFKVKAQEYAEATTWIQEDLEKVKYQAENLQFPQTTLPTLPTTVAAGVSLISINAPDTSIDNNFAQNDTFRIGLDPTNYKINTLPVISGTGLTRKLALTITPTLVKAEAANALVVSIKMCNPSARNTGLADSLRDTITGSNQTGNSNYVDNPPSSGNNQTNGNPLLSKFTNKPYSLRRTTTLSSDSPYNVLQIKYEVSPGTTFDSSKVIATFDTEVLPNVAFQCS